MSESSIVLFNMCLYIALSAILIYKYEWNNLSVFLSIMYTLSAIFSFLLYNIPLYELTISSSGKVTLEPCLYMFVINFLLITSFAKCNLKNCKIITNYNKQVIENIEKTCSCLLFITLILSLPEEVRNFFSGKDLSELRDSTYGNNTTNLPFFFAMISRLVGSTPILIISIVAIKYTLLNEFKSIDKFAILIYALAKISKMLGYISRGTIMFSLIEVFIIFWMFANFFDKKAKKSIIKYSLIIIPFLYLINAAITYSRFSSNSNSNAEYATLANYRYAGESQLNFMALLYPDMKKPFHGYSQFPLFRRIMGLTYSDGTERDGSTVYSSYLEKTYGYQHPIYVFYGLTGSFLMNWGYVLTFIIAIMINIIFRYYFISKERYSFMNLVLIIITAAYIAKGVFYEDYGFESGNFLMIYLFVIYFYFKKHGYTLNVVHQKK